MSSKLAARGSNMGTAHSMSKIAALLLLAAIAACPERSVAFQPRRSGQESFLTRAVFSGGRLWLLSDSGDLSSVSKGKSRRVVENLPEKVADLCVFKGRPTIVTAADDGSAWTLRERAGKAWSILAKVPSGDDRFVAIDCAGDRATVLTSRRLIEVDTREQRGVALSGKLNVGPISSTYGTPNELFVGFNAGEWGGGLRRIDRRSGQISVVERNSSRALCGGPLNTDCDPVNGIAGVPWKPGCVAVAVGLVHLAPHGRLVEVCGDQVQELYERPYKTERLQSTVAFFGLVRKDDTLWAIGIDGLHGLGPDGKAQVMSLPRFKDYEGIGISFDLADFVLVLTRVNERKSVSGAVPLIVPR